MRGMPEHMANLRKACVDLKAWKAKQKEGGGDSKESSGLPSLVTAVPGITATKATDDISSAPVMTSLPSIPVPSAKDSSSVPKQQQQQPKPKEEKQSQQQQQQSQESPGKKYVYVNINL